MYLDRNNSNLENAKLCKPIQRLHLRHHFNGIAANLLLNT